MSVGGIAGPVLRPIVIAGAVVAASSRYRVTQAGAADATAVAATAEAPLAVTAAAPSGDSAGITVVGQCRLTL